MPPCPAPDACHLYLIRHGATANNTARPPRIQGGGIDTELSDEGIKQARRAAGALAEVELAAVYCSPMRRARQTAEIVAASRGLTVTDVPALREVNVGRWEGKTWPEIAAEEPEPHRLFLDDPAAHGYAGGENLTKLLTRVEPALDQILRQHTGQSVAVVAHNVVNRVYLATLLGVPLSLARTLRQDNCGLNLVRLRGDRRDVMMLNSLLHL